MELTQEGREEGNELMGQELIEHDPAHIKEINVRGRARERAREEKGERERELERARERWSREALTLKSLKAVIQQVRLCSLSAQNSLPGFSHTHTHTHIHSLKHTLSEQSARFQIQTQHEWATHTVAVSTSGGHSRRHTHT